MDPPVLRLRERLSEGPSLYSSRNPFAEAQTKLLDALTVRFAPVNAPKSPGQKSTPTLKDEGWSCFHATVDFDKVVTIIFLRSVAPLEPKSFGEWLKKIGELKKPVRITFDEKTLAKLPELMLVAWGHAQLPIDLLCFKNCSPEDRWIMIRMVKTVGQRLRSLDLRGHHMRRDDWLEIANNCTSLEECNLNECTIQTIDPLPQPLNIQIIGVILAKNQSLNRLSVRKCELDGSLFEALHTRDAPLEELDVSFCNLDDNILSETQVRAFLRNLKMEGCSAVSSKELLPFLERSNTIHTLDLSNHSGLHPKDVSAILGLMHLRKLILVGSKNGGEPLFDVSTLPLSYLTYLDIRDTNVTLEELKELLIRARGLTEINLRGCKRLTPRDLIELRILYPNLCIWSEHLAQSPRSQTEENPFWIIFRSYFSELFPNAKVSWNSAQDKWHFIFTPCVEENTPRWGAELSQIGKVLCTAKVQLTIKGGKGLAPQAAPAFTTFLRIIVRTVTELVLINAYDLEMECPRLESLTLDGGILEAPNLKNKKMPNLQQLLLKQVRIEKKALPELVKTFNTVKKWEIEGTPSWEEVKALAQLSQVSERSFPLPTESIPTEQHKLELILTLYANPQQSETSKELAKELIPCLPKEFDLLTLKEALRYSLEPLVQKMIAKWNESYGNIVLLNYADESLSAQIKIPFPPKTELKDEMVKLLLNLGLDVDIQWIIELGEIQPTKLFSELVKGYEVLAQAIAPTIKRLIWKQTDKKEKIPFPQPLFAPFAQNATLRSLTLEHASLQNVSLQELYPQGLQELALIDCQGICVQEIRSWNRLTELRKLNLEGTKVINDQIMQAIAKCCTALTHLNLANTQVTDLGLQQLDCYSRQITHLNISNCTIFGAFINVVPPDSTLAKPNNFPFEHLIWQRTNPAIIPEGFFIPIDSLEALIESSPKLTKLDLTGFPRISNRIKIPDKLKVSQSPTS